MPEVVEKFTQALFYTRRDLAQHYPPQIVDYLMQLIVKDCAHKKLQALLRQE